MIDMNLIERGARYRDILLKDEAIKVFVNADGDLTGLPEDLQELYDRRNVRKEVTVQYRTKHLLFCP